MFRSIVAEVVRHGRLRWFGHVQRKSGDDWVSACRNVMVAGGEMCEQGQENLESMCKGGHS